MDGFISNLAHSFVVGVTKVVAPQSLFALTLARVQMSHRNASIRILTEMDAQHIRHVFNARSATVT